MMIQSSTKHWTTDQRAAAANRARASRPWQHATGPRTPHGKRIVARNAIKHGRFTAEAKSIRSWLNHAARMLKLAQDMRAHHSSHNPDYQIALIKTHLRKKKVENKLSSQRHNHRIRHLHFGDKRSKNGPSFTYQRQ
jgi:hypothetical protein